MDITSAPNRKSLHWTLGSVTWEEILQWAESPSDEKECGNYILGRMDITTVNHPKTKQCTGMHRRKEAMLSRSAITLDVDRPSEGFVDRFELLLPYTALIHTTHSSTPELPRFRVIIPISRDLLPDEYRIVVAVIMEKIGYEEFDHGSTEPERYMFKPAAQKPEWYQYWTIQGIPVDVDAVLADPARPVRATPPKKSRNKRDPYTLEGVVGSFNRCYSIEDVIEEYVLPYEPAGAERWRLIGADSEAGMALVGDGLVFSHHAHDPAYGETCSAFDLVRFHRFGDLDDGLPDKMPVNRRPSHKAMCELAVSDNRVIAEIVGLDFEEMSWEEDEYTDDDATPGDGDGDKPKKGDWRLQLSLTPRSGQVNDTIQNWDLIIKNDPVFQMIYFNELTLSIEVDQDLPWRPLSRGGSAFNTTDHFSFTHYLERAYKIRPTRWGLEEYVATKAQQRYVNPIRDYLESLEWDGIARVEECLPGVHPTQHTRLVARKSLVAAVARIFDPGVKWDHTLVLYGEEGLGKTFWVEKMALGHSATLGRIGDKDTLLVMNRSWIMIADESYSLRKGDADVMKEFLTRSQDTFRMPYDRETLSHKRRCVIWGTTNDEVFLRRQEGNRRFLIVKCEKAVDFDVLTEEYIGQVWAEAVAMYRAGERLFLDTIEGETTAAEREIFTEEDAMMGVIQNFLDTKVPPEWDQMSSEARRMWIMNEADGLVAGKAVQTRVCSSQIWVEALGRRFGEHKRTDLLEITATLKKIPGWSTVPGRTRVAIYGPQVVYERDGVI